MKFRSRTNLASSALHSTPGEIEAIKFAEKVFSDGHTELIEVGKTNIVDFIQQAADSCDIYKLIERHTLGETGVLNRVNGVFLDTVNMPKNLMEAHQLLKDTEKKFMTLPLEIREKFGNNSSEFIAGIGTGKVNDVLNDFISKTAEKINTENKKEVEPNV